MTNNNCLNSCRMCQCVIDTDESIYTEDVYGEFFIRCPVCNFESPHFKWECTAISWWNGDD